MTKVDSSPVHSSARTVEVRAGDAGMRLDRWFKRELPAVGNAHLQKLLRTGQVRVDGGRATASVRLTAGQQIRVPPLGLPAPGAEGQGPRAKGPRGQTVDAKTAADLLARVLYRDEDIIALNKPPGLAVQGGTGTTKHLDGMLDALRFEAEDRPRLVHRLDRDTSGVLLLARNARAAAFLAKAFQKHSVRKTYWALTVGVPSPPHGTIDVPLAKAEGPRGRERMEESEDGDAAITEYRVIEDVRRAAWVELSPRTGRTHQLRAHMAAIGTPIAGDRKYGTAGTTLPGIPAHLHLHAAAIDLHGPSGTPLRITAPLPAHMAATWKLFGFEVPRGSKKR